MRCLLFSAAAVPVVKAASMKVPLMSSVGDNINVVLKSNLDVGSSRGRRDRGRSRAAEGEN
jgi:hypothetical protein